MKALIRSLAEAVRQHPQHFDRADIETIVLAMSKAKKGEYAVFGEPGKGSESYVKATGGPIGLWSYYSKLYDGPTKDAPMLTPRQIVGDSKRGGDFYGAPREVRVGGKKLRLVTWDLSAWE